MGEESSEELDTTDDDSDGLSDCPTVVYDLDNPTVRIPPGLLLAWERNGEIRRSLVTINKQIQTSPPPSPPRIPDSFSGYSTPSYSPSCPVNLTEPIDNSPINESFIDLEVNEILDYLDSEEFLDTIAEL